MLDSPAGFELLSVITMLYKNVWPQRKARKSFHAFSWKDDLENSASENYIHKFGDILKGQISGNISLRLTGVPEWTEEAVSLQMFSNRDMERHGPGLRGWMLGGAERAGGVGNEVGCMT